MVKGAIEAVNKRDDIKDSAHRAGSTAEKGVIRIYLSRPDWSFPASEVSKRQSRRSWRFGEKRFFYRSSDESGEKGRSRCICICRKFRGDSCRRTGDRRKD